MKPFVFVKALLGFESARAKAVPPLFAPTVEKPAEFRDRQSVSFFHVTSAGSDLWLRAGSDKRVVELSPVFDPAYATVAVVASSHPHFCFVFSPNLTPLQIGDDLGPGSATALRVLRSETSGAVQLRFPLGNRGCLTAYDVVVGVSPSKLRFQLDGDRQNTMFKLVAVSDAHVPAAVGQVGAELGQALATGLRASSLLSLIRSGVVRSGLVQPLVWVMPDDELAELGRLLLTDPSNLALVQTGFPGDFWLHGPTAELAEWTEQRPAVASNRLHSAASQASALLPAMAEVPLQAGVVLHSLARRSVLPRRTACIVATARNEGAYLLDWISYHLSIGFEHIFLYTNDNADNSVQLLDELARHGVITLIENERADVVGPQLKAYTHALTMLPQTLDYRWTAVLDVDEYLGFDARKFATVAEFIAAQETRPVDAVALCWLIYCASPLDRWSELSSLERFVKREVNANPHVKSMFKTRLFWHTQPHFPTATLDAPFHYRTERGAIHHHAGVGDRIAAYAEHPSAENAWVNHYIFRSADEALWKLRRGRADWFGGEVSSLDAEFRNFVCEAFLTLARPEHQVEDRRILACRGGQANVLADLTNLPRVAQIDRQLKPSLQEPWPIIQPRSSANRCRRAPRTVCTVFAT